MATGFVLISVEPGTERDVFQEVIKIKEVVDVHLLFGEYDLIARIEAEDYDVIGDIVVNKVRKIPGVTSTKTLAKIQL
jgi:DNA-binding Lrp family transcriptional regulator